MANVNKVILVGRLTRDPEVRSFPSGGKVVAFGFAVSGRKKNNQTGQWDDDPVFLDCELFGSAERPAQADLFAGSMRKGSQAYLEGKLKLDQWKDATSGQNRQKIKVIVDTFQFLDKKDEGQSSGNGRATAPARASESSGTEDDSGVPF